MEKKERFLEFLNSLQKEVANRLKLLSSEEHNMSGEAFEEMVLSTAKEVAKGTAFEEKVKGTGKYRFPDLVVDGVFGIEVKVTIKDSWKSTGNSILETKREAGVETIYMLFGKCSEPVGVKVRLYQECLEGIGVTHSPRYKINMDLDEGESIFDKMGVQYDTFRERAPIQEIQEYFQQQLKPGEQLWWVPSTVTDISEDQEIRNLNSLEEEKKDVLRAQTMLLFPQLFSGHKTKYADIPIYLVKYHSVVTYNLRDLYSAGGRSVFTVKGKMIEVPHVYGHLFNCAKAIAQYLAIVEMVELLEYWKEGQEEDNKMDSWKNLLNRNAEGTDGGKTLADNNLKLSDVFEEGLNASEN